MATRQKSADASVCQVPCLSAFCLHEVFVVHTILSQGLVLIGT